MNDNLLELRMKIEKIIWQGTLWNEQAKENIEHILDKIMPLIEKEINRPFDEHNEINK